MTIHPVEQVKKTKNRVENKRKLRALVDVYERFISEMHTCNFQNYRIRIMIFALKLFMLHYPPPMK